MLSLSYYVQTVNKSIFSSLIIYCFHGLICVLIERMLEMETEDVISLPASSSPANGGDNEELNDSGCQPSEQNCQSLDVLEVNVNESHGSSTDIVNEDNQLLLDADNKSENQDKLEVIADAGLMEDGNGLCNHAEDAFQDSCPQTRANCILFIRLFYNSFYNLENN